MDWMHFWTVLGQLAIAVVGLSVPLAFGAGLIASSIRSSLTPRETAKLSQTNLVRPVDLTPPR